MIYQWAAARDLERLVALRLLGIRVFNHLPPGTPLPEEAVRSYYRRCLADGSHAACFALEGEEVVGTGGLCFYQTLPTYHNPSGNAAFLMNLYTAPAYRRRGVATHILNLLLEEARRRGVGMVTLDATAEGRPLYEKHGFTRSDGQMELEL